MFVDYFIKSSGGFPHQNQSQAGTNTARAATGSCDSTLKVLSNFLVAETASGPLWINPVTYKESTQTFYLHTKGEEKYGDF